MMAFFALAFMGSLCYAETVPATPVAESKPKVAKKKAVVAVKKKKEEKKEEKKAEKKEEKKEEKK